MPCVQSLLRSSLSCHLGRMLSSGTGAIDAIVVWEWEDTWEKKKPWEGEVLPQIHLKSCVWGKRRMSVVHGAKS